MAVKKKVIGAVEEEEQGKGEKPKKSLDELFKGFEKKFGITDRAAQGNDIPRWKCSAPCLSYITAGGVPKGKTIEIFGPESSGKTTVAYIMAGDVQRAGGRVALLDVECAYAENFAARFVNTKERWHVFNPETVEQTYTVLEELATSGHFDLVILDSLAAMTTEAESNGEMGESHMGLQARLIGQGNRKVVHDLFENQCTVVLINQIRFKIGVVYGNPEVTTGGNSTKFFASIRIDVRCCGKLEDADGTIYGIRVRMKSVKNKTGAAHRVVEYELSWTTGINLLLDYAQFAASLGFLEKEPGKEKGSWFSFNGTRHNGMGQFAKYLSENADDFFLLKEKVDQMLSTDTSSILSDESLGVTNAPAITDQE